MIINNRLIKNFDNQTQSSHFDINILRLFYTRNNTIPMYSAGANKIRISISIVISGDKKKPVQNSTKLVWVSALEGMSEEISDVSSIYIFLFWRVNIPYPN